MSLGSQSNRFLVFILFDLLEYGVKKAEILGAELAQARFDDQSVRNIMAENKAIRDVKSLRRAGIGISAFCRDSMGYSFTVELSKKAVAEAAQKAFNIARAASLVSNGKPVLADIPQSKGKGVKLSIKKHPKDASARAEQIQRCEESLSNFLLCNAETCEPAEEGADATKRVRSQFCAKGATGKVSG